jgi:dolichol kinase
MYSELKRRLVHVAGTGVPALYLLGLVEWRQLRWLLVAGSALALGLEVLRLGGVVDWRIFDELTREYEQDNLAGYALYALGMAAAGLAFEPRVAVPAMLMLTIADPISGLLGSGSLEKQGYVLVVTFGVCVFLAAWFVPLAVAVAGALVAALADGLKPVVAGYVIDDNITIPIGAAVAMFAALELLPAVL